MDVTTFYRLDSFVTDLCKNTSEWITSHLFPWNIQRSVLLILNIAALWYLHVRYDIGGSWTPLYIWVTFLCYFILGPICLMLSGIFLILCHCILDADSVFEPNKRYAPFFGYLIWGQVVTGFIFLYFLVRWVDTDFALGHMLVVTTRVRVAITMFVEREERNEGLRKRKKESFLQKLLDAVEEKLSPKPSIA